MVRVNMFECPANNCSKDLKRLQVMHFRYKHDCEPYEWVNENYGKELEEEYLEGFGCY